MIESFSGENRFLSNFWPSEVRLNGMPFSTVEHAYQASKTDIKEIRLNIQSCGSPAAAKKCGQHIKLRDDWNDELKLSIMEYLLRQKFQDEYLKRKLIYTYPQELIEGNWWGDTFWGTCNGVGENHLGKLLMKIRLELVKEENSK